MNAQQSAHQEFKAKLESLGYGAEEISVFGVIRTNVHIVCMGRGTAQKWANALTKIFSGTKVQCVEHVIYAKTNKGTNLRPTTRKGWLVAVAA